MLTHAHDVGHTINWTFCDSSLDCKQFFGRTGAGVSRSPVHLFFLCLRVLFKFY